MAIDMIYTSGFDEGSKFRRFFKPAKRGMEMKPKRKSKRQVEAQVGEERNKENGPHKLVQMSEPSLSGTDILDGKNGGRLVGLMNRSPPTPKVGSSMSKIPKQLGHLNLTTQQYFPKVVAISSPTSTSIRTDASATSVVTENRALSIEERRSYSSIADACKLADQLPRSNTMFQKDDGIPQAGALFVDLDIRGDSKVRRRHQGVDHGTENITGTTEKPHTAVATAITKPTNAPTCHSRKKLKICSDDALVIQKLGSWGGARVRNRGDVSMASECSERQETQEASTTVCREDDDAVFAAAFALLALASADAGPSQAYRRRNLQSSSMGVRPQRPPSPGELPPSFGEPSSSTDRHGRKHGTDGRQSSVDGRESVIGDDFRPRATSVLPRPGNKQRFKSMAALLSQTEASR